MPTPIAKYSGKDVYELPSGTAIAESPPFSHKKLTTGPVMNLGDACVYGCTFCYVEAMSKGKFIRFLGGTYKGVPYAGIGKGFQDVVIRRCGKGSKTILDVLKDTLDKKHWKALAQEHHVCFTSSTVDPVPNAALVSETAAAMVYILQNTVWDIRVLSKSVNLPLLAETVCQIDASFKSRMIFGVSTGTLDDKLAKVLEAGTPLVSKRIKSLHKLQDNGFRTFGMICPSLPQVNFQKFSDDICAAIRVDKCEHVWAEPMNCRGANFAKTHAALTAAGFTKEATMLAAVSGKGKGKAWDDYAWATFQAHTKNVPAAKLRFLHYPKGQRKKWLPEVPKGAVLLGGPKKPKAGAPKKSRKKGFTAAAAPASVASALSPKP